MNFLSIDQHIAVCSDVRYIFNQLGHTVTEMSLSGHAPIIGKIQHKIDMLSGDEWGNSIRGRKFKEFADRYGKHLEKYDGFLCCYPPIFAMLYKHIDKPIIIDIPIRYECGAECDAELWEEFNDYLREGVDSGKITLVANNRYDKHYAENFIKKPIVHIPSLCEYSGMSYNPINELFIYYSDVVREDKSGRMIKKHNALKAGHAWQCIADFKGCIHYPYNISTMSTFEQYTANIPLFFPTEDYLLKLWENDQHVLTQISWKQQVPDGEPNSEIKCASVYDPNNYNDKETITSWIKYADFYSDDMNCIEHFDENTLDKVLSMKVDDLMIISDKMRKHNVGRKEIVYKKWNNILRRLNG